MYASLCVMLCSHPLFPMLTIASRTLERRTGCWKASNFQTSSPPFPCSQPAVQISCWNPAHRDNWTNEPMGTPARKVYLHIARIEPPPAPTTPSPLNTTPPILQHPTLAFPTPRPRPYIVSSALPNPQPRPETKPPSPPHPQIAQAACSPAGASVSSRVHRQPPGAESSATRRQERKPPARKADGRGARGAETTVGGVLRGAGWTSLVTCHFTLLYFTSRRMNWATKGRADDGQLQDLNGHESSVLNWKWRFICGGHATFSLLCIPYTQDSTYIKLRHEKARRTPRRQTEPADCAETAPPSYRSRRPPLCLLRSEV